MNGDLLIRLPLGVTSERGASLIGTQDQMVARIHALIAPEKCPGSFFGDAHPPWPMSLACTFSFLSSLL